VDLPPAPATLGPHPGRFAGRVGDWTLPARGRRRTRKGWIYVAAFCPDVTIGLAVVDAGALATAFVYVHDHATMDHWEQKLLRPMGFSRTFAPGPSTRWELGEWLVTPTRGGWEIRAPRVTLQVGPTGPGLTAIDTPPGRPFHHTWKDLGVPVVATVDGVEHRGRAGVDLSLGHPPRRTLWNWASLDTGTVGVNLVAHLLDGLENAVWTPDGIVPVGQALFSYAHTLGPWHVRTVDGAVDVVFSPVGQRAERFRGAVVSSRFAQPYGTFAGTVLGEVVSGRGVVEEHDALW
jgi:hypothetical protein